MNIFLIGHITLDTQPFNHVGGGVSYSAVVARKLGWNPYIITKAPPTHLCVQELQDLGISVNCLPIQNAEYANKITTFENYYDTNGNRQQKLPQIAERITVKDAPFFPEIKEGSEVFIAPVADEIDPQLITWLSKEKHCRITVTPQGFLRAVDQESKVEPKPLSKEILSTFDCINTIILSDEDLGLGLKLDPLISSIPIVVLTKGRQGLNIYEEGKLLTNINIFKLKPEEENDFTGAGDTTAMAFLIGYRNTRSLKESASFAALYAAAKIASIGVEGNIGIKSIPKLEDVQTFLSQNPERYAQFLEKNNLRKLSLLEGIRSTKTEKK